MSKTTDELLHQLKHYDDLDESIKSFKGQSFKEYFEALLEKCPLSKHDIILHSGIERTYFYRILSGERSNTSKGKICRLALTMHLTQEETDHLLSLSNNGQLYPKNKRDYIILYALYHHLSVIETNIQLEKYNEELI